MKDLIIKVASGVDLTMDEASHCMDYMLSGNASEAQIASFLTALRMKGETVDEIIGSTKMMREKAFQIKPQVGKYIDFVGTGGDGTNTFNISTTSALVVAASGIAVAKHGNRAASSRSGSTDVLESLGINVMLTPDQVQECVDSINIGYMNAQLFHTLMKNVAGVRRELGIRTIFNILGPLTNPSGAKSQLIGVFDKKIVPIFAKVMQTLGVENALIVCGSDGMDEITTTGITHAAEIKNGVTSEFIIDPKDYGFDYATAMDLKGGDATDNAKITIDILKGKKDKKRDIVLLNAGAAIYVGGGADNIQAGIEVAKEIIDSGKAYAKLQEFIKLSNSFGGAA